MKFQSRNRLQRPADFRAVFTQASHRISANGYVVLARSNNLPESRLGFALAKKKVKRATDRNSARRLHRECFRLLVAPELKGYDFVVVFARNVTDRTFKNHHSMRNIQPLWTKLPQTLPSLG